MQASEDKKSINKFPLRLMPSERKRAEEFSRREGVSLNQFINVAVAERLVHLQHEAWVSTRPKPTPARIALALAALDRVGSGTGDAGDTLPEGFESVRHSEEYKKLAVRKRGR